MPSYSSFVSPADNDRRETEPTPAIETNASVSDNSVGKELQSALKPINMMLAIFFCAKYKIRNNMIKSNSVFNNIISVFAMIILTCCCYYSTFDSKFLVNVNGFIYIQHLAKIYVFLVVVLGNILSCFTNISQKYNNVLFVIKIQAIYTKLKINKSLKRFILPNWISVIALIFYHISWILFSHFVIDFLDFGITITNEIWLTLDMNILYATRIMKLLTNPLKSWMKNARMTECVYNSEKETFWNTMLEVYMEIFEAYKIFEKTFKQLVLVYYR